MIQTFRGLTPPVQVAVTLMMMLTFLIIFGAGFWGLVKASEGAFGNLQWGQFMLWATTISGFAIQAWREARNRGWAIEDRQKAAEAQTADIVARAKAEAEALVIETEAKARVLHLEALAVAEKIRIESVNAALLVRADQKQNTQEMLDKLQDVHEVADKAFKEANHVNLKIENLNQRLLAKTDDKDKLDILQETANDVETKVDVIREHQKKNDEKEKE